MDSSFQRDDLDNQILTALMEDARTPFAELAKRFSVSAGTIHVRVEKMKQALQNKTLTLNNVQRSPINMIFSGRNQPTLKDFGINYISLKDFKRQDTSYTP